MGIRYNPDDRGVLEVPAEAIHAAMSHGFRSPPTAPMHRSTTILATIALPSSKPASPNWRRRSQQRILRLIHRPGD
jgi:hypothetical protein